ncbi:MAG TPA: hypothetical protein VG963_14835, partial [Polyangiaceae bacterium]|nr:hypothetical protein [Polyangiaceae bacterium]
MSQALVSCGSDDKAGTKVCTPVEDLKTCTCGNQRSGTQPCNAEGTGYDACNCDGTASAGAGGSSSTGAAGSSSVGTAGSAGSATAPGLTGGVGLPCTTDTDCPGAPLICVPASSDGFGATDPTTGQTVKGGPQGGYCTLPCTGSADCQAVDGASACNQALQYCFALCQPGSTGMLKCVDSQGAPLAQACYQLPNSTTLGACIPTCTNDAACGAGRYCDLNTGLCVSTKPTGKAIGEACDATLTVSDCASGECAVFDTPTGTISFCSGTCTLGVTDNCGYDPQTDAKREAGCIEPQFDNPGVGD